MILTLLLLVTISQFSPVTLSFLRPKKNQLDAINIHSFAMCINSIDRGIYLLTIPFTYLPPPV